MVKIYLPELGENITKATVTYWYLAEGAAVKEGDDLVEVATDKATFNVPAPCSGTLREILIHDGDEANVGDALAVMDEGEVKTGADES